MSFNLEKEHHRVLAQKLSQQPKYPQQETNLIIAAETNNFDLVKQLVEGGANINETRDSGVGQQQLFLNC